MSDTKWRKLFSALDHPGLELRQAIVKFVDSDEVHVISTPTSEALRTPKPYVDTFKFGPISLREIEWIEFPAFAEYPNRSPDGKGRVPSTRLKQDIDRAEAVLADVGRFPTQRTERGLRITGYSR